MAKIAIDIDSTLYDFASLACQTMGEMAEELKHAKDDSLSLVKASRLRNAAYSTTWTEWRTPIDLAGEEAWLEVVDRCHEPDVILAQTPYDGASEEIWNLWNAGHEIVYVSNRNSETTEATAEWLDRHVFPLNDEHGCEILCHPEDKLASIRDCQYLIDDRPKTLVQFLSLTWEFKSLINVPPTSDLERKAFGLVTPYNRNLTDIPGIYLAPSWPLLGRYLREKIRPAVGV